MKSIGRMKPLVAVLGTALVLVLAGCTSSGTTAAGGSGNATAGITGAKLAALKAKVAIYEQEPTKILATSLGAFTPKPGGSIYLVSCDLSIVGCHALANGVQTGTEGIGYKFQICNAGTTSDQANKCFTNAINAKPDVIIVDGNGVSVAGAGYAAAKKAGIPIVGLFTSNPKGSTNAEVADTVCTTEGQVMADAVIAEGDGHPDTLYAGETSQQCDSNRTAAFRKEYPKACPSCAITYLGFDYPTAQQSLPPQLQSALTKDPKISSIVGVLDQTASIAVTQVQQAGKQKNITVAGMDGNPPNVQLIRQGQVQTLDMAVGQGEDGWTAVDAAARIYSGQPVPFNDPVNTFLITAKNVSQVDSTSNTWLGPETYQAQFKALWGKG